MLKPVVALAILSAMSAPVVAQTAPATSSTQPAKPQTVKKRVCEKVEDDNPYSRLGSRTICRTVEVPAEQATLGGQNGQQAPATTTGTAGATNNNM